MLLGLPAHVSVTLQVHCARRGRLETDAGMRSVPNIPAAGKSHDNPAACETKRMLLHVVARWSDK